MQPLFSPRSTATTVATKLHRGRRAGFKPNVGYSAQKRILMKFQDKLVRMRLRARARGDVRASIVLTGFCTPAILLDGGSRWVVPLSRKERQAERMLRTGCKRPNALAKQRPADVVRVTFGTGVIRLLKARRKTRTR